MGSKNRQFDFLRKRFYMKDPTFKLEGVIKLGDETEDFEGPLTLILQLLSKNKIEIQDIKISELLGQYLAYLDEMKAMDLEVTSEFVAMASHLVYIKARMLLSAGEEPSELEELIRSLERLQNRDVYESIKNITGSLEKMLENGYETYTKPPEYIPVDKEYKYTHEKQDILDALLGILSREDILSELAPSKVFVMPSRIIYPVSDKEEEILSVLMRNGETTFQQLIEQSKSRTEAVATFIAILELCKAGKIGITGEGKDTAINRMAEVS
jgi:segregation and condensation protein A